MWRFSSWCKSSCSFTGASPSFSFNPASEAFLTSYEHNVRTCYNKEQHLKYLFGARLLPTRFGGVNNLDGERLDDSLSPLAFQAETSMMLDTVDKAVPIFLILKQLWNWLGRFRCKRKGVANVGVKRAAHPYISTMPSGKLERSCGRQFHSGCE